MNPYESPTHCEAKTWSRFELEFQFAWYGFLLILTAAVIAAAIVPIEMVFGIKVTCCFAIGGIAIDALGLALVYFSVKWLTK